MIALEHDDWPLVSAPDPCSCVPLVPVVVLGDEGLVRTLWFCVVVVDDDVLMIGIDVRVGCENRWGARENRSNCVVQDFLARKNSRGTSLRISAFVPWDPASFGESSVFGRIGWRAPIYPSPSGAKLPY